MATALDSTCAESAQLGVSSCVLFKHSLAGHNTHTQMQLNPADRRAELTWRGCGGTERTIDAKTSVYR